MKLFFFVGIVWAALVGPGYTVLILDNLGASNTQIGTFTAVSAVLSMVFQPVWGMISDKIGSPRRVLCFCLVGSITFFGCVLFTDSFSVAIVLLLMDIIFRCGIVALLDSHTIAEVNTIPGLQYGHISMAGSVFFGILSLAYSGVINNFGLMAVIPISIGVTFFAVCWGLIAAKGKSEGIKAEDEERAKPNLVKDALSLLSNSRYIALILFIAVSALVAQPLWIFLIRFVEDVGGSPGHVPLIHALRCVVEIPLFILVGTKFKNLPSLHLMIMGMFFMFIYAIMLLFANSIFMVIAAHMFGGTPGFIFGLTGRLKYLNEVTPDSVRSTSITLMGTVELGLGAILGNLVAGILLDAHGIRAFMLFALGVLVLASVILFVLVGIDRRKRSL